MVRRSVLKFVIAYLSLSLTVCFATFAPLAQARERAPTDNLATVSMADLPRQGVETYQLIRQGGPFPYDKDGVVFGNRERLLPSQKRGYYLEYTVKTPGSRDRGARRIVCGGQPKTPDVCFYTADHYASFRQIVP
jgi:ribonuclease T1